jgi:hypothetical protein
MHWYVCMCVCVCMYATVCMHACVWCVCVLYVLVRLSLCAPDTCIHVYVCRNMLYRFLLIIMCVTV